MRYKLRIRSGVDIHARMWYGSHDDLLEENSETCFLTLEADFSPVLQGFFPHPLLVFTSLRISWEE